MLKLRINPIVAKDLKNIRDYIAEDNEEYAAKTIKEIYGKFENLQMFPGMGADLSKRVSFRTDYKYAIWEDYVIIYKIGKEYVEIYRVVNRYQDIIRIFDQIKQEVPDTIKFAKRHLLQQMPLCLMYHNHRMISILFCKTSTQYKHAKGRDSAMISIAGLSLQFGSTKFIHNHLLYS